MLYWYNFMVEYTVLCYIEKENKYLMLYRNKEVGDPNMGMYIGVGGHMEKGETKEETLLREVYEETGLKLLDYTYRGKLIFSFDGNDEIAYLYTSKSFSGTIKDDCEEGELMWVDKGKIKDLNIYEGDKYFLDRLDQDDNEINLKLIYKNDKFIGCEEL